MLKTARGQEIRRIQEIKKNRWITCVDEEIYVLSLTALCMLP